MTNSIYNTQKPLSTAIPAQYFATSLFNTELPPTYDSHDFAANDYFPIQTPRSPRKCHTHEFEIIASPQRLSAAKIPNQYVVSHGFIAIQTLCQHKQWQLTGTTTNNFTITIPITNQYSNAMIVTATATQLIAKFEGDMQQLEEKAQKLAEIAIARWGIHAKLTVNRAPNQQISQIIAKALEVARANKKQAHQSFTSVFAEPSRLAPQILASAPPLDFDDEAEDSYTPRKLANV